MKLSKTFTVKLPKRDFTRIIPKRFDPVDLTNWVVWNGGYPPLAFINWGQTNITPFDVPTGTDSTTPFEDLP